jgi:flagellin-like hook-associated protein FlgL
MMGEWEKAVDFEFQQILEDVNNNNNVGDIRMAFTTDGVDGGRAAYAYYPSSSPVGGDVWFETHDINSDFDPAGNDFNSLGLGEGGYSWYAALHEVGHALGLSHPFLNANNQPSAVSGVVLPLNEDNMRTSVMSYTQFDRNMAIEWNGSSQSTTMVYATTPMLADVKAVELMYGAETTSDGDTTYNFSLDGSRLQPLMMQTIIDSGGVDTIDLSNQTRTNILNMNGDTLSSIGYWSESDQVVHWASVSPYSQASIQGVFDHYNAQATAGKATSMIYTGEHNLGIAKSAQIENAIGGSADDTITGNALDNMITGGGGNDTIDGGEGNDVAIFSGNKGGYNISTIGDTTTVSGGADGTDTLTNIEFLQFKAGAASARGASIRTSLTAVTNLSGTSTFDVSVDGGASVNVTFSGQDYTSGGLSMNDLMVDLETAINSALANDGQSASVTVSQNSPLQITSNNTGGTSAISLSSLSGPLQAALGNIENEGSIENGDTIYYAIGGGYITSTPSGNFTPTNPTPSSSPTTPTTPTLPTTLTTTPTTPTTTVLPEVIEANPPGLPSHISGISLATQEDAAKAIMVLDRAIEQITQSQAKLGAIQNRLDYTITNLTKNAMLTEAAKGRITDADFAAETAILVKNQILSQAATQALNMANQSRQSVMGLIS